MTSGLWGVFAPHRKNVTNLLTAQHRRVFGNLRGDDVARSGKINHRDEKRRQLSDAPSEPRGKLCLLGAGNANDVDLRQLLSYYDTIDLVDIDGSALARAVSRHFPQLSLLESGEGDRVTTYDGVDLLGLEEGREIVTGAEAAATMESGEVAFQLRALLGRGSCDVTAATGLLSMLMVTLGRRMGFEDNTPMEKREAAGWEVAVQALRRSYVTNLAATVRSGGVAVHVSDLAYAHLAHRRDVTARSTFEEEDVWRLHINTGDFFPGTNPYALAEQRAGGSLRLGSLWRGTMLPVLQPDKQVLWYRNKEQEEEESQQPRPYWMWCTSANAEFMGKCALAYAVTWLAE